MFKSWGSCNVDSMFKNSREIVMNQPSICCAQIHHFRVFPVYPSPWKQKLFARDSHWQVGWSHRLCGSCSCCRHQTSAHHRILEPLWLSYDLWPTSKSFQPFPADPWIADGWHSYITPDTPKTSRCKCKAVISSGLRPINLLIIFHLATKTKRVTMNCRKKRLLLSLDTFTLRPRNGGIRPLRRSQNSWSHGMGVSVNKLCT